MIEIDQQQQQSAESASTKVVGAQQKFHDEVFTILNKSFSTAIEWSDLVRALVS